MAKYVLVHGAWHGGWAWDKVKPILEAKGHTVLTPDLPGHGADRRPVPDISLGTYVDSISALVASQAESVVLVGHSMSGAVISQVAERIPDRIERLVYVCAFLLPNGGSVLEAMGADDGGQLAGRLTFNIAGNGAMFDENTLRETFYNSTDEVTIQQAIPQLLDVQPVSPLGEAISVTAESWGKVPRTYVKCMEDLVLTPEAQQRMINERPATAIEIQADHAPFLSAPQALAAAI